MALQDTIEKVIEPVAEDALTLAEGFILTSIAALPPMIQPPLAAATKAFFAECQPLARAATQKIVSLAAAKLAEVFAAEPPTVTTAATVQTLDQRP
ncbi:MAG: hypothetical protein ACYDAR_14260 [Thermomicrobiales bacterium]